VCSLVSRIVAACPEVSVLATSRVRLGLGNERVVVVEPLPRDEAVALYADRVARAAPAAAVDERDPRVARICRRLDGLPLALELAAGRTASLGVAALHDRLDHALDLLEASAPDTDPRHATLGAVVDWSRELLDPQTQALFDALAVFERGFTLEAAEHVGAAAIDGSVAPALARLVDASLVLADHDDGEVRYRMLETVRASASRRLRERGAEDASRAAHLRWFAELSEQLAATGTGPGEREAWRRLDAHRDDLRAALRWATGRPEHVDDSVRIAAALARLVLYRADAEIVGWIRTVVEHPTVAGTAGEPVALAAGARAAWLQGDHDTSQRLAARAVAAGPRVAVAPAWHALGVHHLYRGEHDEAERAWRRVSDDPHADLASRADALGGIALARCYAGDLDAAERTAHEMRIVAAAVDSPTCVAFAAYVAGELALARDPAQAVPTLREAARRGREARAEFIAGVAGTALVSLLVRLDRGTEALDELAELIDLWRRTSTWPQQWTTLRLLAELLVVAGDAETAGLLLEAADRDPAAPAVVGADAVRLRALRTRIRDELGPDGWAAVSATARLLPRARVVAQALDTVQVLRADRRT
jgi:predicted ATPase